MSKHILKCSLCDRIIVRSNRIESPVCITCRSEKNRIYSRNLRRMMQVKKEQNVIERLVIKHKMPSVVLNSLYYDRVGGVDGVLRVKSSGMKHLTELTNK